MVVSYYWLASEVHRVVQSLLGRLAEHTHEGRLGVRQLSGSNDLPASGLCALFQRV